MDFYGVDTCRELGLPCLQPQTIPDTPVSPGWPPVTKRTTIRPSQSVTLMSNSSKSRTQGPPTMSPAITLRNSVEEFSTFSPHEECFSADVEDDDDGNKKQLAEATTLSNVSVT